MITPEQEKWLSHVSDSGQVKNEPFDTEANQKFEETKKRIQSILGDQSEVLHRGSSALRISGQPEIDIYIPVSPKNFDATVSQIQNALGKPYSAYPLERVKFILFAGKTKLEIMVVNETRKSWIEGEIFFHYMEKHPNALDQYRKLKEDAVGLSNRTYYRRKIEFMNDIMARASSEPYENKGVVVRPSPIEGLGLFAKKIFKKGETVLVWNPKRLSEDELKDVALDQKRYINKLEDGTSVLMQPPERYVNSSDHPNTRTVGESDVATRDIQIGEEITSSYFF